MGLGLWVLGLCTAWLCWVLCGVWVWGCVAVGLSAVGLWGCRAVGCGAVGLGLWLLCGCACWKFGTFCGLCGVWGCGAARGRVEGRAAGCARCVRRCARGVRGRPLSSKNLNLEFSALAFCVWGPP